MPQSSDSLAYRVRKHGEHRGRRACCDWRRFVDADGIVRPCESGSGGSVVDALGYVDLDADDQGVGRGHAMVLDGSAISRHASRRLDWRHQIATSGGYLCGVSESKTGWQADVVYVRIVCVPEVGRVNIGVQTSARPLALSAWKVLR